MAIRSSFASFETAKRALTISQLGLNTVGHNITNVETDGYTRQRVDQVSVSSTMNTKYQVYGNYVRGNGMGAKATGISQIRNSYLDTRYRNEAQTYGELAIKGSGMTDLENIFDEILTKGLHHTMGEFINELIEYQSYSESKEYALTVRSAAESVIQVLNTYAAQLKVVEDQQKYDMDIAITMEVNSILEQVATLNEKIREANLYGDPANELNDDRNMLIDQLSEYLPIKVVNTPEQVGRDTVISNLSIVLMDNTTIPATEIELVNQNSYNQLSWKEDEDGFVSIQLNEGKTDFVLQDITHSIKSGAIKGYIDMINGLGEYAGSLNNAPEGEVYLLSNTFRGVKYYQNALDTFASEFAALMNRVNSISDAEAANYNEVTAYPDKNLFEARDGGDKITAANITISAAWYEEPTYITLSKVDRYNVHSVDENGDKLYDEEGNPVYEWNAQNDNLVKFVEALQGTNYLMGTTVDGNSFVFFRGSFQEAVVSIESTLATDKQLNDSLLKASESVLTTYADQRSSISGVSIDEEAVNMMVYQNYYNAAARYMTVLDEALGTIIQGMGVVGR